MSNSEIKILYGKNKNGIPTHINDVERGLDCECFCVACSSPLVAVKGKERRHHFRHLIKCGCVHGFESGIHLAAKHLIMANMKITLPKHTLKISSKDSSGETHSKEKDIVSRDTGIKFDVIEIEKSLSVIRPDVLAIKGDKNLIIEIRCSHKVDEEKINKIKMLGISAIEIDLSSLTVESEMDKNALWSFMNDSKHIKWLYHVDDERVMHDLKDDLKKMIADLDAQYDKVWLEKLAAMNIVGSSQQERLPKIDMDQLRQDIADVSEDSSEDRIMLFKQQAEHHPAWQNIKKTHRLSLDALPSYLNVDVDGGDYVFGCDRRIWQTALYFEFFVKRKSYNKYFTIKTVNRWLRDVAMCNIPSSVAALEKYGDLHPGQVMSDVKKSMVSPSKALHEYFQYLWTKAMLEYVWSEKDQCRIFTVIHPMPGFVRKTDISNEALLK